MHEIGGRTIQKARDATAGNSTGIHCLQGHGPDGLQMLSSILTPKEEKMKRFSSIVQVTLVIVFSFSRFLYLPLPKGMGIFRDLSNFMIF